MSHGDKFVKDKARIRVRSERRFASPSSTCGMRSGATRRGIGRLPHLARNVCAVTSEVHIKQAPILPDAVEAQPIDAGGQERLARHCAGRRFRLPGHWLYARHRRSQQEDRARGPGLGTVGRRIVHGDARLIAAIARIQLRQAIVGIFAQRIEQCPGDPRRLRRVAAPPRTSFVQTLKASRRECGQERRIDDEASIARRRLTFGRIFRVWGYRAPTTQARA